MHRFALLLLCWSALLGATEYADLPALSNSDLQHTPLLDIEVAGERVIAVGERGLIIYSDDRGQSWLQAKVPVSHNLTALSFPDPQHGWAVGHGGVILHSADAGVSWTQQFNGDRATQQWLGYTTSKQEALEKVLSETSGRQQQRLEEELEDIIYEVEDTRLALKAGPANPFLDVWFRDAQEGWAVGAYGLLFHTIDGGERWRLAVAGIDNADRFHYYQIAGGGGHTLYLSGEGGLMYRSDDNGKHWDQLPLDYEGSIFGVIALERDALLCFGLRGNIFRSTDRGESWVSIQPQHGAGLSLYGGQRVVGGAVVLVGAGGSIVVSRDAGLSFVAQVDAGRSSFTAVTEVNGQLLLGGMSGLLRVPMAQLKAGLGE